MTKYREVPILSPQECLALVRKTYNVPDLYDGMVAIFLISHRLRVVRLPDNVPLDAKLSARWDEPDAP